MFSFHTNIFHFNKKHLKDINTKKFNVKNNY